MLQLTVFAVSGILAGVLNRFGKPGVIIGFLLGNAILTYLANGNTATIIYFREIFIASVLLLVVPSNIKIRVQDLFGREKALPSNGDKRLKYYEDVKDKLDVVADAIDGIDEEMIISSEDMELKKEIYIDNFLENFEDYNQNIFYEDVTQNQELIGDIFDEFTKEDVVTENILIDIFKKYNNFILLRDQKIKDDLQELIKISNRTYRELQINTIKQKTRKEEKLKMKNELKNVSNMIKKVSTEEMQNEKFDVKEKELNVLLKGRSLDVNSISIYKAQNGKYIVNLDLKFDEGSDLRDKKKLDLIADTISKVFGKKFTFQRDKKNLSTGVYIQTYSAEDKFGLAVGSSKTTKHGSKISGDSNLQIRLDDGKYLLAISDGMGSGESAKKSSKFVINTLNNFLEKGFEEKDVLNLINSELNLNKNDEMYASVDMSILDLYTGNISMIKNGACNTYIKTKKDIRVFSSNEMPVGIVENVELYREMCSLNEGDIILMCSDGLLDASKDDAKSDWIQDFLKNINTTNVQKIADLIVSEAIDNSYGNVKDDITVVVAKIIKK